LIDYGPLRARRQIVFESFNTIRGSFRKRFHTAIGAVAHVTNNLMPRRRALGKETVANSLHVTAYEKLSRYFQDASPSLLLTLDQSARFAAFERKRFRFVNTGNFQRQRHRVAFDRSGVGGGLSLRCFVGSHWSTAFGREASAQFKFSVVVNDKWTFDRTVSAVPLNLCGI
jgi:hypothetical protein